MRCQNCGAELSANEKFCEFCGSQISASDKREQEYVNRKGCPECGSSNVQFARENHGEIRGKNSKQIVHRTVGFCKDCGSTWYPRTEQKPKKQNSTWVWVLGWIFIFPIPLTILMLRNKKLKPAVRYTIIGIAWIIYLAWFIGVNSESSNTSSSSGGVGVESTSADGMLDVNLDVNCEMKDGEVSFAVDTNLPDDTVLMLSLTKGNGNDGSFFMAQDKVTVKNGMATSSGFMNKGEPLVGNYDLAISMSLPSTQSNTVTSIIGEKGENLGGQYVIEDLGSKMVRAYFSVSVTSTSSLISHSSDYKYTVFAEGASDLAEEIQNDVDIITNDVNDIIEEAVNEVIDSTLADETLDDVTMGQRNAIKAAESYLRFTAFSKKGLIEQLSSEYGDGYSIEDATFAVEYLEQNNKVDWNEQAKKSAESYLGMMAFSRDGLIDQLSSPYGDQYTKEQAEYAASAVGY